MAERGQEKKETFSEGRDGEEEERDRCGRKGVRPRSGACSTAHGTGRGASRVLGHSHSAVFKSEGPAVLGGR